jgi:hypothetical protein
MVGRQSYATPNGTFYTIGKVQDTTLYSFQQGNGGEKATTGDMEVLVCMNCPNGGTGKVLSFYSTKLLINYNYRCFLLLKRSQQQRMYLA